MTSRSHVGGVAKARTLVQTAALAVAAVFVLVGILGFIPGITTNYGDMTISGARSYLIGGGAIYLVLWLYGLVVGQNSAANFVPLNAADDWLHLFLGLGMIALGFLTTRRTTARGPRGPAAPPPAKGRPGP